MTHLNAPWRAKYHEDKKQSNSDECVFCADESAVIFEDLDIKIVMNKFPYSPGHILILPKIHAQFLNEISPKIWQKMSDAARFSEKIMREKLRAQGVNIGLNLGAAAGAGIASHLHLHVLPRWWGDTNFITTICDTRVLGSDLDELFVLLKEAFASYDSSIARDE